MLPEFSCYTASFNDLTLMEAMGTAARLGFRSVDLATGSQISITRAADERNRDNFIAEIQADLALFNLRVADFHAFLPRISINDDEKRTADIETFKALLPFASALQIPGITVSAGLLHPASDTDAFARSVDALQMMQSAANQADIALSIIPHPDSMAQTVPQIQHFLDEVPGLELTLDVAFMTYQNISSDDWFSLLDATRHMHLRTATQMALQVTFDNNTIDVAVLMQQLKERNYSGYISMAYLPPASQYQIEKINVIETVLTLRDELRNLREKT
ncbi:MAG: sugar phosphate isomerase/epimerase family protein [Aggregatilineales bacterium]